MTEKEIILPNEIWKFKLDSKLTKSKPTYLGYNKNQRFSKPVESSKLSDKNTE